MLTFLFCAEVIWVCLNQWMIVWNCENAPSKYLFLSANATKYRNQHVFFFFTLFDCKGKRLQINCQINCRCRNKRGEYILQSHTHSSVQKILFNKELEFSFNSMYALGKCPKLLMLSVNTINFLPHCCYLSEPDLFPHSIHCVHWFFGFIFLLYTFCREILELLLRFHIVLYNWRQTVFYSVHDYLLYLYFCLFFFTNYIWSKCNG